MLTNNKKRTGREREQMKIDAVFSGGGVKIYAFAGVLDSFAEKDIVVERAAGTSAGAIIASLISARYSVEEIKQFMYEIDLKLFLDPPRLTKYIPFSKWLFLYFQLGINKGNRLEQWLYEKLAEKNIYTFHDIEEGYLKVVVSDLSLGKLVVIPDDLERLYGIKPSHFPVAKAVRMSAGFPYFFMPKKLPGKTMKKSIIVDGGLLSNFPLWIFDNGTTREKRPVLGIKLTTSYENQNQSRDIRNAFDMFTALFATMKQAHDARYVSTKEKNNIIFIPVDGVDSVDFHLSEEKKSELFQLGKARADQFLRYWPK
jgi:NTE family protein